MTRYNEEKLCITGYNLDEFCISISYCCLYVYCVVCNLFFFGILVWHVVRKYLLSFIIFIIIIVGRVFGQMMKMARLSTPPIE